MRLQIRFTSRTLLFVLALLCIGLTFLATEVRRSSRVAQTVRQLRLNGAKVSYDWQGFSTTLGLPPGFLHQDEVFLDYYDAHPRVPQFFGWEGNEAFLSEVASVEIDDKQLDGQTTALLGKLESLKRLCLRNCTLSESAAKNLANLKNLTSLHLSKSTIENLQVIPFNAWPQLEYLYLDETGIHDEDLPKLTCLRNLRALDLSSNKIGDRGAERLSKLNNLQDLYLDDTQIGDEGLARLSTLEELDTLGLSHSNVGDRGALQIAKLPNLEHLSLFGTKVSDSARQKIFDEYGIWAFDSLY